jgi:hypothetical protein
MIEAMLAVTAELEIVRRPDKPSSAPDLKPNDDDLPF